MLTGGGRAGRGGAAPATPASLRRVAHGVHAGKKDVATTAPQLGHFFFLILNKKNLAIFFYLL